MRYTLHTVTTREREREREREQHRCQRIKAAVTMDSASFSSESEDEGLVRESSSDSERVTTLKDSATYFENEDDVVEEEGAGCRAG